MNILLIHPCVDKKRFYGYIGRFIKPEMPLGLYYLIGSLRNKGMNVKLIDEQFFRLSPIKIRKIIKKYNIDLVGLSCLTPTFERTSQIAKWIKNISVRIKVVVGNLHPSIFPEDVLKNEWIDLVVRREGEITFWECIETYGSNGSFKNIKGISYKTNGRIFHNKDKRLIEPLDILPWPDYKDYIKHFKIATLITSRGCPYKCTFCSKSMHGAKYRFHSPKYMVSLIQSLLQYENIKFFHFEDSSFLNDKGRVIQFCNMLLEKKLRIRWGCNTRTDSVDAKILKKMKSAGCRHISYGIETSSQRLLDIIKKGTTIQQNAQAIHLTKKMGIKTRATFLFGIPTETNREIHDTIKFALDTPLDFASFKILTPYPGSEFYNSLIKEGMNLKPCFSSLNSSPCFNKESQTVPYCDIKKLKSIQLKAYLKFYLRPKQIKYLLKGKTPQFNLYNIKNKI